MSDIKPYKEQKKDFLYLKIPMKDACKFIMYNEMIKERLADNKPVPLRFYDRMINLLRPAEKDKEEYYRNARETLTNSVCEYFKNDPEYYFSISGKEPNIREILMPEGPVEMDGITYYPEDYDETKKEKESFKKYQSNLHL
jgi:hypothetical protein